MSKLPILRSNKLLNQNHFSLKWVVLFWLFFGCITSQGQVGSTINLADTNKSKELDDSSKPFTDVSDKLLITTGFWFKGYTIDMKNIESGNSVSIAPTGSVNLGFGVNYKWLGIAVSFGLPSSKRIEEKEGETQKQDYQLNLYSNAFVAQGHLQYYKGFHVSSLNVGDSSSIQLGDGDGIIPSLSTYSLGVSGWYFFNHKKFSYKAAYVRNAIQKKHSGSVVTGLYYGVDRADADLTIGENLPDSLQGYFDVLGYTSQNFGVSLGYSQTFVFNNFFINGTLVPGIGVKNVSLMTSSKTYFIDEGLTGRLVFNLALGYEANKFLFGARAFTSSRFFEAEGFRFTTGTNSFTLYVGKRFNIRKSKKKS